MNEIKNKRESNFELLRIIAILLIITSHFCVHSTNQIYLQAPFTFNIHHLLTLIFTTGCIANNIFILITGYFMVNKKINYKKIISLVLDMEFYSIIIYLVLSITGLIKNISPIKSIFTIFYGNWFCIYYIILYLFIPYLNHLLNTLPKETLKKLIITILVLVCIVPTFIDVWSFSVHDVFILSYLIGGYIKLYPNKNITQKKIKSILIYTILLLILCITTLYVIGIHFKILPFIKDLPQRYICSNSSIFVIIIAICIFLLFKNKKIKYNQYINTASTTALGIYLIHDNYLLREIIWNKIAPISLYFNKCFFPIYAITKILAVFIICYIIVRVKQIILNKPHNYLTNKIYNLLEKIIKKEGNKNEI